MKRIFGFTLLEIMIAVVIVGILSGLCLPLFFQHIVQEKRTEAEMALSKLALALEQYYGVNNTYRNASLSGLGFSDTTANHAYQLAITQATESYFQIQAVPVGGQAEKDKGCGTLSLDSEGQKSISGNGKVESCW